jgi:hypothetical protein
MSRPVSIAARRGVCMFQYLMPPRSPQQAMEVYQAEPVALL